MDFITIPAVLTIIGFFIYKLFELFVCKKERLYMIEHMKDISFEGKTFPLLPNMGLGFSFSALKWGCFLIGLGVGLLVAYFVSLGVFGVDNLEKTFHRDYVEVIFGGSLLLFGGLGLLIAFIIEMKMNKTKKSKN